MVVPFRNGKEIGVCVGRRGRQPLKRKPKAVLESPDAEPALGAPLLELCRWIADYYVVPLGVALRTALPAALTGAAASAAVAQDAARRRLIADELPSLLAARQGFRPRDAAARAVRAARVARRPRGGRASDASS